MDVSQAPRWDEEAGEWITGDGRRFAVRPDGASGFRVVSYGADADGIQGDPDAPATAVYATESEAQEAALRLAEAHRPGGELP
ncbi:MAG: hypothetical protein M3176_05885 [Chloroflexota bacterium]|nr:hypothetical protein [Chloroflexota bacterium]